MIQESVPKLAYWHLYTDESGVSHQTRCKLDGFKLGAVGGAAAQWNDKQEKSEATVVFVVLPAGWIGEWHENPAPQWIVPVSGRWWVQAMDGTRIEMGRGEISLGEDQRCVRDGNGRIGHRSGTSGDGPTVLMTVQLHVPPSSRPCHLK